VLVLDDGIDEGGMQPELYAGFLQQLQSDELQSLRIERDGVRDHFRLSAGVVVLQAPATPARPHGIARNELILRWRVHRGAERVEPGDDLVTDASDGLVVLVGHIVEDDHLATAGQAAQVRVALGEDDAHPTAGGRDGGGDTSRAAADDEDIGHHDNGRLACRLANGRLFHLFHLAPWATRLIRQSYHRRGPCQGSARGKLCSTHPLRESRADRRQSSAG
jgi:hypothetical protein